MRFKKLVPIEYDHNDEVSDDIQDSEPLHDLSVPEDSNQSNSLFILVDDLKIYSQSLIQIPSQNSILNHLK